MACPAETGGFSNTPLGTRQYNKCLNKQCLSSTSDCVVDFSAFVI